MVDGDDVRRIAMSLPETEDRSSAATLNFHVRGKQFAWTYLERVKPGQPRQPRPDVLAVRCAAEEKELLLDSEPEKFFTTDHYRGYPAVLVRLAEIDKRELTGLLLSAWRCQAPRSLVKQLEGKA